MPDNNPDDEITLASETMRLKVSSQGASLRGLWRESADGVHTEIVTTYTGASGKVGGQGDVLIPFPGRVAGGNYTFDGQTYQMVTNDKESPSAIHGFLRTIPWDITDQSSDAITFTTILKADDHPGYPFALEVAVTYGVDADGMSCHFEIRNVGDKTAPLAAGFHPYFTVGSEHIDIDMLQIPFASTLEFENLLPTGKVLPVAGSKFDFTSPRKIGDTVFNTCYLAPIRTAGSDEKLRVTLGTADGEHQVAVWLDEAFDYVVIYSGDPLPDAHRRRSLAIEPMTCASDAFNHPEWGLVSLAPGATHSGTWGVTEALRGLQTHA